ncbi:MAG: YfcC family protein [Clostridia bacterium]|nr:YfcC family protein [Clostridia bacterium]
MSANPKAEKNTSFANISVRVFVTVMLVLIAVLVVCGGLSYCIPQGEFLRDETGVILPGTYVEGEVQGIAPWRVLTAPVRVFASEDAVTIIMISVFLLIMSGVFNLLEQTGGIRIFIGRIILRLRERGGPVICCTVLLFMLFGSFFGMFEELVTLLPIVIVMMISIGMDTMMGLGACLLAACFGFSAAITNPFSVGLASQIAGHPISGGVWLRIVFFVLTYGVLCAFLMLHLRRITKDPTRSPTYQSDLERKRAMQSPVQMDSAQEARVFRVYGVFFGVQALLLVLIASVRAISGLAIPILSCSFLIGGVIAGFLVCERRRDVALHMLRGAASMLPAVVIIAVASSAKLVMMESGIMDTVMHRVIGLLDGKNPFFAIVLIYFLILFLQVFIGSASAKIMLVMPIVMPVATAIGLSPSLVILAYCMADGFTDVILPTNPVLLVGLSMANVPYGKWVKWTWKLQAFVFALTIAVLFFGVAIGY